MEFQSKSELEQKRAEKRRVREQILDEAKRKYEIGERKAAAAKARGEDKWMLPGLSENLDRQAKKLKKKTKKLKKEKKSKHDKKSKKSKKKSSSSESEESEEDMWVERTKSTHKSDMSSTQKSVMSSTVDSKASSDPVAVVKGPKLQRDDWMNLDSSAIPTISRQELKEKIKLDKLQYADVEKEKVLDEPGTHDRELNPYWKSGGGTGLPEEQKSATSLPKHNLSFLKKAYSRCEQLAEETGQTLESIAEERYGSLENLEIMIMEAEREEELAKVKADSKSSVLKSKRNISRSRSRERQSHHSSKEGDRLYSRRTRSGSTERHRAKHRSRSRDRNRSPRSRDVDRNRSNRSRSRDRNRSHRSRSRDRTRSNRRSRSRSNSRDQSKRKSKNRSPRRRQHESRSSESSSSSQSRSRSPKPRKSSPPVKRRFLKPGEAETSDVPKRSFMKPGDSGSAGKPSWRKPDYKDTVKVDANKTSETPAGGSRQTPREKRKVVDPSDSSGRSCSSDESTSSESDAEEATPVVVALTDDEMNALGAKILKAELMGNDDMAAELKQKLENARLARASGVKPAVEQEKVVILSHADKFGNIRPVEGPDPDAARSGGKRRRAKKVKTHDESGARERYFADDDRFNIKDMVQAEKMTTAEDQHYMFSKMAAKVTEKIDDDNQIDDAMINRARLEHDPAKVAEQQQNRAKAESKKMAQSLDNCKYCLDNMTKHLIIAVAKNTYLCVNDYQSLSEGHCKIIPIHHCMASTVCDEDVWNEVQEFRRNLVKMFAENDDQDCVFMECSKNLSKHPHMVVECIPVPRELGDVAPIYFKKAIDESEKEWAQNKKLISLSKKDIRHSVPKGFPYFSVDFGLQGGFAHVIEDEYSFPSYFGKEVVGGMMDVDPRLWKKPKKESFEDQRKKVLKFAKMWKPFDFTLTKDSDSESS